jgi:hypothetical protein
MARAWLLAALTGLTLTSTADAQGTAWHFRWQQGQVLQYRVEEVTTASEVVEGNKALTTSKLNELKRWQVAEVDAAGVATLQLSLGSLRLERTTPGGESLVFDSGNPDKSNPQMREQLSQYVGKVLAVVRVDGRGKVVEVKQSKFGPASRFESQPPFVLTLPDAAAAPGQGWSRNYTITLEPPEGTGEKFAAVQKYICANADGPAVTVVLATTLPNPPAGLADQIPLLQLQPEGKIVFDTQAGRLQRADLRVEKELKGHAGEGSSYRLQSTYTEEYVAGS